MLRRFFASFLVLLFVSLGLPIFMLWFVFNSLASFDFEDEQFVGLTTDLLRVAAVERLSEGDLQLPTLTKVEIEGVVEDAISEEVVGGFLMNVGEQIVDQKVKDGEFAFDFDVDGLVMREGGVVDVVSGLLYEKLPSCDNGVPPIDLYTCVPLDLSEEDFNAAVRSDFDRRFLVQINDSFAVELPLAINSTLPEFFGSLLNSMLLIAGIMLTLIFGALLLTVYRPWTRVLKWGNFAVFALALPVFLIVTSFVYFPDLLTVASGFEGANLDRELVALIDRGLEMTFFFEAQSIWYVTLLIAVVFLLDYLVLVYLDSRNDS